jgi:hypothetical protein
MAPEALSAAQRVDELERRRVYEQQPTHGSGLLAGEPLNRQPAIRVPQGHHRAIEPELLETAPETGQLLTDTVGGVRKVALANACSVVSHDRGPRLARQRGRATTIGTDAQARIQPQAGRA